ncbi:His-Xaa-Ser repeat protein HxsA protein [Rhizobium phaseoli]|uniref:His-Xaa-Ser repeat protein HxsA n=1 Tax=Rhizobium phaseoli TaxID=396 RepID=UPI0007EA87E5|nr:His-Xaa-Ser repeat protein HxsA [Rhizobium phaseoli]ANM04691.1 His-Xaa-Ser repeat protein HxsA protein [Rhizobium phaseoli]
MKKRLFLIPSFFAAGFLPSKADAMLPGDVVSKPNPLPSVLERLKLKHIYTLAGHRSHSSHSSHSSHRSSSGGGYSYRTYSSPSYSAPAPVYTAPTYTAPKPVYTPPPAPAPVPVAPSPTYTTTPAAPALAAPLKTLPGNSEKFTRIVMQVQTALTAYGYYSGLIDGKVGPACKTALVAMQTDYKLRATGTITPEVLDAFGIAAN